MQTTGTPAPKRDYIAELQACATLEALCRLRDELIEIVFSKRDGWEYAARYRIQASSQIEFLNGKGVFLVPVENDLSELRREIAELRDALAQTRHNAFMGLVPISEMEPEINDIEEAIARAKEQMALFAPSPTDHTNQ